MTELYDNLTINDLPEDIQDIAEICGIKNTIKLIKHFEGDRVYFSNKTMKIALRNRYIRTNYNGTNARELAQKFNITKGHLYEILKTQK